ncbi:MAG: exo-alpha-sialidase [Candidatus Kapabacteria bacterium]|nr:exo-alpha-sialidase [Candidatus Kapabacteria bacterium]
MKKILFSIILFSFLIANAEDEGVSQYFKKLMENAHPTPILERNPDFVPPYLLQMPEVNAGSEFENRNTVNETSETNVQNENSIAINPKNPKNLIASAVDYRDNSSTWVYISSDGGKTWENKNLGKVKNLWPSSNDPSVAFAPDGTAYLMYGAFNSTKGENGVFFARSTNEGKTWEAHIPVIIHTGTQTKDSAFEDKYYIEVDDSPKSAYYNNLYTPWKRVTAKDSATQIVIARSTDKGTTWQTPIPVSPRKAGTSEDTTYGQSFPLTTTGPNGELYVVWNDGIVHGVGFAKSLDGGLTFTQPRIIKNYNIFGTTKLLASQGGYRHTLKGVVRAETYPVIQCDWTQGKNSGNLYLTWAGDSIPNIYFSKSTDKGETWSQAKIIHSTTKGDQFWQWLSIDPTNGELAVMYMDSRDDDNNLQVECYVSYSQDAGETWIDRKVSDTWTDIRKNPFSGNSFSGDYSGCTFYNGTIYPSWFDTRNVSPQTSTDDDVYTAIVNTKAPNAPKNFVVAINPEMPDRLNLSWEPDYQSTFGKTLSASEISFEIYRNNMFSRTFTGNIKGYIDSNLTPFTRYDYSIKAVNNTDSSVAVKSFSFSGGAKQPDSPVIVTSNGTALDNNLRINIKIPSFRADKTTPLSNIKELKIFGYEGKTLIGTLPLSQSDTGKSRTFEVLVQDSGYHKIRAVITSSALNQPDQVSDTSNQMIAFAGKVSEKYFNYVSFEETKLPRFYIGGNWQATSEIAFDGKNSFTESPNIDYKNNQSDTLMIYPFIIDNNQISYLDFYHIAEVEKKDTCYVEASYDNMQTWNTLAIYDKNNYIEWQDKKLNPEDWKHESLILNNRKSGKDTVFVRFRFQADFFKTNLGWYIDKIYPSYANSVEDFVSNSVSIYPNPAKEFLNINFDNTNNMINSFSISNSLGEKLIVENNFLKQVDISKLNTGIYFVKFKLNNGSEQIKQFIVIK